MKTPGNDNINAKLQAAGPQMTQRILELLNTWRSEKMPNEWNK